MKIDWGTFEKLLETVGMGILASHPLTAPIAPVIQHAISEAQKIKGSGDEKKAHALAIVRDAVTVAHEAGATAFGDPSALLAVADHGIDTVVGAIKVIQGAKVAADPIHYAAADVSGDPDIR